jgi:hypothetical protein
MTEPQLSAFEEMESVVRICSDAMFAPARGGSIDALLDRRSAAPSRVEGRPRPTPELLSFIDFMGPRISGTLLLRQDPLTVVGTHPCGAGHLSENDVLDWANERVNQLAGRVANRLNARGISIQIGLPATVHASGPAARDRAAFTSVYEVGSVEVYLRARVHHCSSPSDDRQPSQYVSEGAILLF